MSETYMMDWFLIVLSNPLNNNTIKSIKNNKK